MAADNGKPKLIVRKINEHLSSLDIDVVTNRYISANQLNKKRLDLQDWGRTPLANFNKNVNNLN